MSPDPVATDLDSSSVKLSNPTSGEPDNQDQEVDPVVVWVPSKRHLITGLLGLNVFLLGMALVAGQAFNPDGLKHEEPEMFILLLIGISLSWMLWYLLWARNQPDICPHKDHHAGGITVTCRFLYNTVMTQYKIIFGVIKCDLSPLSQWSSCFLLQSVFCCPSSGLVILSV